MLLILTIKISKVDSFRSPILKAYVSFSDQNDSVVCCCRKLFTFSSSLEPFDQLLLNLAQNILGGKDF